jgi:hypothetical protein
MIPDRLPVTVAVVTELARSWLGALAWVHERIGLLDTAGAMFLTVKTLSRRHYRLLRKERERWETIRAHLASAGDFEPTKNQHKESKTCPT